MRHMEILLVIVRSPPILVNMAFEGSITAAFGISITEAEVELEGQ
jgi:hypothetical protein